MVGRKVEWSQRGRTAVEWESNGGRFVIHRQSNDRRIKSRIVGLGFFDVARGGRGGLRAAFNVDCTCGPVNCFTRVP